MLVLKSTLLILFSIAYGFALSYFYEHRNGYYENLVGMITAAACLTGINMMAAVFEINSLLEKACYIIMLLLVFTIPYMKSKIKRRTKK